MEVKVRGKGGEISDQGVHQSDNNPCLVSPLAPRGV